MHVAHLRHHLSGGARRISDIEKACGVNRSTLNSMLPNVGTDLVRCSIQGQTRYALRDLRRASLETSITRVDALGILQPYGRLIPVLPDGFVLVAESGSDQYSEGLPWWLYDMCPQGYLGRLYAKQHARHLRLPEQLSDWSDTHVLRAMLHHGADLPGDLLIGEHADKLSPTPQPLAIAIKADTYLSMASAAETNTLRCPWIAGEQPKFTAYVRTEHAATHVIVKFSAAGNDAVSQRWKDLLLAEHIALDVLNRSGVPASKSRIIDHAGRRFLEVERFDRIGATGRIGVTSLAALDTEFVGTNGRWYQVTQALAEHGGVDTSTVPKAALLWAFGKLIGNNDMHNGNLSFIKAESKPSFLAPAYDMAPMSFAPIGGSLRDEMGLLKPDNTIAQDIWQEAIGIASRYTQRLMKEARFSEQFKPCIQSIFKAQKTSDSLIGLG